MYSKNGPRKRSKGLAKQARQRSTCAAAFALLFFVGSLAALDKLRDLQEHFDKESHAAGKVKALDKLIDAEFDEIRRTSAAGDFVAAGLIFEKYRDNVRACFELLKKQLPDADKHSSEYRRLELQTRRGLREIEDTLVTAPPDVHPPLEIVRKDILDMDDELIRLLFPKRTPDPQTVPPPPPEPKP
jgi:hypothetical protein